MSPSSKVRPIESVEPAVVLVDPFFRSFISLAILVHLLCMAFVAAANVKPSRLQMRLAGVLAPYTQLLHLDPGGARLQFTDGSTASDDHYIVVVPKSDGGEFREAEAVRIPEGRRIGLGKDRQLTIANEMAAYAERDELIALFAKSIGASVLHEKRYEHVVVRLVHKGIQPLYEDLPPTEQATDYNVYEAEVWIDEDGELQMLKRASGRDAAPASA